MHLVTFKPMAHASIFPLSLILSLSLVACGGGGEAVTPTSVLPTITQPIRESSYLTGSAELAGYTVLQQARKLCDFGELTQNTRLDTASRNHARYLNSISLASGVSVLSHYEDINTDPFYTGYAPWDRTAFTALGTDYGTQVAEVLLGTWWNYDLNAPLLVIPTMEQRGTESMRSLLNSVYHLAGAMYDGADVGFGTDLQTVATGTTTRHEEFRFGSLNGFQTIRIPLGAGKVATYPCQGSSNIPTEFVPASEMPNPLPSLSTAGPPIYLKVDAGQNIIVTHNSVVSQNGVTVPTTVLTASDPYIDRNEVFVVPTMALSPYTTYQVTLAGTVNNVPFSRSFAMSTGL
jgi:hypothetical protein